MLYTQAGVASARRVATGTEISSGSLTARVPVCTTGTALGRACQSAIIAVVITVVGVAALLAGESVRRTAYAIDEIETAKLLVDAAAITLRTTIDGYIDIGCLRTGRIEKVGASPKDELAAIEGVAGVGAVEAVVGPHLYLHGLSGAHIIEDEESLAVLEEFPQRINALVPAEAGAGAAKGLVGTEHLHFDGGDAAHIVVGGAAAAAGDVVKTNCARLVGAARNCTGKQNECCGFHWTPPK